MSSPEQIGVRCGARFTTYEELFGRALRATRGLHDFGVGAGDRVALLLRNSLEFLEATVATVPLGASAVPINWHWRGDEVGRALERAVIKILDGDGHELPTGESGEVYMWLDVWPDFTYAGDQEKRRAVERDGLISCGDIGYLDADGYLYLNDRRSDMVISGGVNIYPAEIEACLLSLDGVRDCAVFGIPHDEFGETLAAHVERDAGSALSADQVQEHVRAKLAPYKTPRVVEFSDSLPREDSGKIFKRRLRDPYWSGRERAI